ncbi:hypothetical protein IKL45_01605 [Candidatus Saccharibacteria bacterium]|nr:hypothetical protein [Candidatus Saccharibacteria bacterium]MBR6122271.1 hypothetical protein [Candidatus Saccharibacteria bacterium]
MKPSVIFFGNGPLADFTLEVLRPAVNLLFHAKTKEDLATVKAIKQDHPDAHGVLASFGVMIKQDVLDLFEPEGILNIHPSLLPKYRGASPIESAILAGDSDFSVSVMKLVLACDAGPIYYQTTLKNLPLDKTEIYKNLAHTGATWLRDHLDNLPTPQPQDDSQATFTQKLDKSMSFLTPDKDSADTTLRKIVAYQGFPKPKYTLYGHDVIILSAHLATTPPEASKTLSIKCADGQFVVIDRLQPLSRKPMDARSFLNGLR